MTNYLFADEELEEIPPSARHKINRIRFQQVKEALRISRKYQHKTDKQVGEDFDVSPKTVSRIKQSRTYNRYIQRRSKGGKTNNGL